MNKASELRKKEFTQIFSYVCNVIEDDEATHFLIAEQLNSVLRNGIKCEEDGDIGIAVVKAVSELNYLLVRNFDELDDGYFDYEGMIPEPFEFTDELVEFLFENVHMVIRREPSVEKMIAVIFADLIFTGTTDALKYILRKIKM